MTASHSEWALSRSYSGWWPTPWDTADARFASTEMAKKERGDPSPTDNPDLPSKPGVSTTAKPGQDIHIHVHIEH